MYVVSGLTLQSGKSSVTEFDKSSPESGHRPDLEPLSLSTASDAMPSQQSIEADGAGTEPVVLPNVSVLRKAMSESLESKTALLSTEELLHDHHAAVFGYAYRLTGNSNGADDIAQEVFVRAFRSLHQLREPKAARGWLLTITRNEFSRWCKTFAPKPSVDPAEVCLESAEIGQVAVDREEWVQQALEQLPLDYRNVVNMFYFEQLSYSEIAAELSLPIGTVMSRLNRGRKHLKKALNALAEPKRLAGNNP